MLEEIKKDTRIRMNKSLDSLRKELAKIRTGRAHPSLLEHVHVDYYGSDVPISQAASVAVEDARTLAVTAWDKSMVPQIEKAIMKSALGLNPSSAGDVMRIPLPPLTEETRKLFIRQARAEAESARVSVRNARRDSMAMLKELLKDKEISEDEERRAEDEVQKITDRHVATIEKDLSAKEADLMEI